MSLAAYFKDRLIPFLIMMATVAITALVLWVTGISFGIILALCALIIAALFVAGVWDYLSRRRFYASLEASLKAEDPGVLYISELVSRPNFTEGTLTYDVLEKAVKNMNDEVALYRHSSLEYREYIESWIHEIKTPIAASRLILANAQSSQTQPLENELDRVESYIEQALYYSRSTAVEKDYLIKAVNLDTLIKSVVRKHSRSLIEAGITPELKDLDTNVYTDAKWLDFVIGQIVVNAIKYHRPKQIGHSPRIVFSAERANTGFEGESVVLSIYDNGIGIPAADITRIFEKGFTGENGRLYSKSTGIGLYLSKKLCDKMKLKISASSDQGKNTTVTIEFPLSKMFFLE